jgi:hypothetical protein
MLADASLICDKSAADKSRTGGKDMAVGSDDRRQRGRPALPEGAGKRYSLGIRTTKELRDALKAAAEASGRSVAHEIEQRLERSFTDETAAYGGPQLAAIFRQLAAMLYGKNLEIGSDVFSDYAKAQVLLSAWRDVLHDNIMPEWPEILQRRIVTYERWMRGLDGDKWPDDLKRDVLDLLNEEIDQHKEDLPDAFRDLVARWIANYRGRGPSK